MNKSLWAHWKESLKLLTNTKTHHNLYDETFNIFKQTLMISFYKFWWLFLVLFGVNYYFQQNVFLVDRRITEFSSPLFLAIAFMTTLLAYIIILCCRKTKEKKNWHYFIGNSHTIWAFSIYTIFLTLPFEQLFLLREFLSIPSLFLFIFLDSKKSLPSVFLSIYRTIKLLVITLPLWVFIMIFTGLIISITGLMLALPLILVDLILDMEQAYPATIELLTLWFPITLKPLYFYIVLSFITSVVSVYYSQLKNKYHKLLFGLKS